MNILIVSPAYAPYAGVGANRMMSLSAYLVSKGYRVIVLRNTPELWPEESRKSSVPEGVEVADVYASGSFQDCVKAYYVSIEKIILENKIDMSIYSCNPYYTAPAAAAIKKKYGIRYIIDFRDLWIKDEALTRSWLRILKKYLVRLPYRKMEEEAVRYADSVLTVTPKDCECLQKQYPDFAKKINVIYNGYDEARLNTEVKSELEISAPYIGIFGKFGYYDYKYVLELLYAVKQINEENIPLKIVHIGDCDNNTRKALQKTKFPSELYVNPGYLDYSSGMKILSNAAMNCLIVHYKRGLGTKLFDYIFLDKPVIFFAHADSSIAEILYRCKNAFLCQNRKDATMNIKRVLSEKIVGLECNNPQNYSRVTQNGYFEDLILQLSGGENLQHEKNS